MKRHTLAEATQMICGEVDLKLPELWVARRLRSGVFPGLKIGRDWFMTDQDVADAIDVCRRRPEAKPEAAASIADGLSARARKLRA